MDLMNVQEAQLFRLLAGVFGEERVFWNMSVKAICGGELPRMAEDSEVDISKWASTSKCLFSIVDSEDNPCLVIDFEPDFSSVIDVELLSRKRILPKILQAASVRYVSITHDEFLEVLDDNSDFDLFSLLNARLLEDENSVCDE